VEKTDRRAYAAAVRILKRARQTAATAANGLDDFAQNIATLREGNGRRPTLIAMLDKAVLR